MIGIRDHILDFILKTVGEISAVEFLQANVHFCYCNIQFNEIIFQLRMTLVTTVFVSHVARSNVKMKLNDEEQLLFIITHSITFTVVAGHPVVRYYSSETTVFKVPMASLISASLQKTAERNRIAVVWREAW